LERRAGKYVLNRIGLWPQRYICPTTCSKPSIAIAAHALAYDATLVTSDTAHVTRIPHLKLDDWTIEA